MAGPRFSINFQDKGGQGAPSGAAGLDLDDFPVQSTNAATACSQSPDAATNMHYKTQADYICDIATQASDAGVIMSKESEALHEKHPLVLELVSFEGQTQLLRASPLKCVLRRGAAVFASSKGTARDYLLSQVVSRIGTFISHNWSVSRRHKFLCLAIHFNFHMALVAGIVVLFMIHIFTWAGLQPHVKVEPDLWGRTERGFLAASLMGPVLVLVLCCGQEQPRTADDLGHTVFLDKTCIHQVDKELQAKSIRKLGAFLRMSSHMVIIYTDVYFKKLWTIYEVACFLALHLDEDVTIIPSFVPLFIFCGIAIATASMVLSLLLSALMGFDGAYAGALFGFYVAGIIFRHSTHQLEAARRDMKRFQLEDCMCACPEDRLVVYANIVLLMRATGQVNDDATDEEALAAFNRTIRQRLPGFLAASLPTFHLTYLQMVGCILCTHVSIDGYMPLPEKHATAYVMTRTMYDLIWTFGMFPFTFILLSKWCTLCLHIKGWREHAFLGLGLILMVGFILVVDTPLFYFAKASLRPSSSYQDIYVGLVIIAVTLFSWIALNIALCTFCRGMPEEQEEQEQIQDSIPMPLQPGESPRGQMRQKEDKQEEKPDMMAASEIGAQAVVQQEASDVISRL